MNKTFQFSVSAADVENKLILRKRMHITTMHVFKESLKHLKSKEANIKSVIQIMKVTWPKI